LTKNHASASAPTARAESGSSNITTTALARLASLIGGAGDEASQHARRPSAIARPSRPRNGAAVAPVASPRARMDKPRARA
jgi:hypothetical protein